MTTETIQRAGCTARVLAGEGYYRVGETLCQLENTGNGYIAKFPSHSPCYQDYYVCLDYSHLVCIFTNAIYIICLGL